MDPPNATVLVVDDERELADAYADWLEDYEVIVTYAGREALTVLDDHIDVVVLDRRIPDLHGDEVVGHITERRLSCRVAMVTGVEPTLDIVDLRFDDYLVKPITREELREAVSTLVARGAYTDGLREHFATISKWAVLTARHSPAELAAQPAFQSLEETIERQRAELDALVADLSEMDFQHVLRDAIEGPACRLDLGGQR